MISPRAWRWFPADCSATGASRPLREPLSSATRVVVFRLVVFQVAVSIDNPWVAAARGTPRHDPSLDADWVDGGLQTGAGSFNPVTCPTTRDVMKHQKQHNREQHCLYPCLNRETPRNQTATSQNPLHPEPLMLRLMASSSWIDADHALGSAAVETWST